MRSRIIGINERSPSGATQARCQASIPANKKRSYSDTVRPVEVGERSDIERTGAGVRGVRCSCSTLGVHQRVSVLSSSLPR